jgi:hypothetical protein
MYAAPLLKLADLCFKFSRRKLTGRHFVPTKILLYHFLASKDEEILLFRMGSRGNPALKRGHVITPHILLGCQTHESEEISF